MTNSDYARFLLIISIRTLGYSIYLPFLQKTKRSCGTMQVLFSWHTEHTLKNQYFIFALFPTWAGTDYTDTLKPEHCDTYCLQQQKYKNTALKYNGSIRNSYCKQYYSSRHYICNGIDTLDKGVFVHCFDAKCVCWQFLRKKFWNSPDDILRFHTQPLNVNTSMLLLFLENLPVVKAITMQCRSVLVWCPMFSSQNLT